MFAQRKNTLKFKLIRINPIPILVITLLFLNYLTSAQTVNQTFTDSTKINSDTLVKNDSTKIAFPISKDKLEFPVKYESKDSIIYDAKKKLLYLHNGAIISYDDIKIVSDYVVYEQDSSRLTALEIDSLTIKNDTSNLSNSTLSQGSETSTFSSLFYNFKSKRALVENAYSKYGEGYILSQQIKRNNDNSINGYKNIYTTCDDPHPHFGIATKKIKIIPNKIAIAGSANLVIEDIPTPLYLPFGLFPLKQGQHSGFLLPTYAMSQQLGFGLREGGYYFAINDHLDLKALADIYALGTWRVGIINTYNYRYRFNGSFSFNYAYNKIGESYEPGNQNSRNFFLTWNHTINPNVLPGSTFSANVNFGSRKYQKNNSYDASLYLNNNYSSSISFSKSWKDKPFNLAVTLRHSQNTSSSLVQITLPEINFSINQQFPFQFRKNIIKQRWYEKIGMSYQVAAVNRLDFIDSTFSLAKLKGKDFQNAIKHSIPISASYNIFKFFNLTFSAGYNEYWYTKKTFREYNFSEAKVDTTLQTGFFTARDFNASTAISTRIYGVKMFKKGAIKGIRHVLTPSVSLNYKPDFGSSKYNYYYTSFTDRYFTSSKLSYFDGAIYGGPSNGKIGGMGFNLGNTLSMKVRSKKDTVNGVKKINLIDGLNFSTFYNMAVDSFKWSNLAITYRTTLYESVSLSGGISYNPYAIDKVTGRKLPTLQYKVDNRLLRFQTASLALTAGLPFKKNNSAMNKASDIQKAAIGNNFNSYADFNIPWSLNINYNINVDKIYIAVRQKDSLEFNQNMNFYGDVNLTPKWKIGFRSGYDFANKTIAFTSLDIYRDLHCWEMKLNIIPFGYRKSYNFSLNVKASVLQDLKLIRRKDFRDYL